MRVGRYSDFWLFTPKYWNTPEQAYLLYLLRLDGLAPKSPDLEIGVKIRGKAFVASYSSATVADSHGVPCADVVRHKRLKELARSVRKGRDNFKKIRSGSGGATVWHGRIRHECEADPGYAEQGETHRRVPRTEAAVLVRACACSFRRFSLQRSCSLCSICWRLVPCAIRRSRNRFDLLVDCIALKRWSCGFGNRSDTTRRVAHGGQLVASLEARVTSAVWIFGAGAPS